MLQRVAVPAGPLNLKDRTVLLVGATSGIGEAMAHQLAAAGATLIIAGRDSIKLTRLAGVLSSKTAAPVYTVCVDLADLGSIEAAAKEIHERFAAIHVLIANAGVLYMGNKRQFTRDGFELMVGVNHIGNAALILLLEDLLRAAAPSRIVVIASEAHRRAGAAPFDDLMGDHDFSGMRAYSRSKLANILFARELARRLLPTGVTVYAAHPGVVDTPIVDAFARTRFDKAGLRLVRKLFLKPERAAQGILRVAADPMMKEPSGTYFELGKPNRGSQLANDAALARDLWDKTQRFLTRGLASNPSGN